MVVENTSVEAGQAVYSRLVLRVYDLWVLGLSNHWLWRCPTALLRQHFSTYASANHLDVGVGSGYYPDRCLSNNTRRLALLDLNTNSLAVTGRRVQRFNPEVYNANVLEPLSLSCEKFDSISLFYLLHCLPGKLQEKSIVFRYLSDYLNKDGTIFGATILGKGITPNTAGRKLMAIYNRKGIFDNYEDSYDSLQSALREHFTEVEIQVVGCVAIFCARA